MWPCDWLRRRSSVPPRWRYKGISFLAWERQKKRTIFFLVEFCLWFIFNHFWEIIFTETITFQNGFSTASFSVISNHFFGKQIFTKPVIGKGIPHNSKTPWSRPVEPPLQVSGEWMGETFFFGENRNLHIWDANIRIQYISVSYTYTRHMENHIPVCFCFFVFGVMNTTYGWQCLIVNVWCSYGSVPTVRHEHSGEHWLPT